MKWLHKRDMVTIAALLIAALLLLLFRQNGTAGAGFELVSNGQIIWSGSLEEDCLFNPEGYPAVTIAVRGGKAAFAASDCPDKTCVHTGFISVPGQIAACLPNGLILRITGSGGVDAEV